MSIIGWIVLGLIVGALAKAIMPGKGRGGIFVTMLLGVVGGLLGGWLGQLIFDVDTGSFFEIRTWLLALAGSLIVLGVYRAVAGRRITR